MMICPMCGLKIPKVDYKLHSKSHEQSVYMKDLNTIQMQEMPKNKEELVRFKYSMRQTKEECEICASDFTEGEMMICLPCLHRFHEVCILKWADKSPTCPHCLKDMFKS